MRTVERKIAAVGWAKQTGAEKLADESTKDEVGIGLGHCATAEAKSDNTAAHTPGTRTRGQRTRATKEKQSTRRPQ
jgi:hypothetical protein